jgi:hypothetical protein
MGQNERANDAVAENFEKCLGRDVGQLANEEFDGVAQDGSEVGGGTEVRAVDKAAFAMADNEAEGSAFTRRVVRGWEGLHFESGGGVRQPRGKGFQVEGKAQMKLRHGERQQPIIKRLHEMLRQKNGQRQFSPAHLLVLNESGQPRHVVSVTMRDKDRPEKFPPKAERLDGLRDGLSRVKENGPVAILHEDRTFVARGSPVSRSGAQ